MMRWTIVVATAGVAGAAAGYWIAVREPDAPGASMAEDRTSAEPIRSPFAAPVEIANGEIAPVEITNGEIANGVSAARVHTGATRGQAFDNAVQTQQLASEFARRQSLYAIAAGADQGRLLELIDENASIANEADRLAALGILLLRLAELDLNAALQRAAQTDLNDASHLMAELAGKAPEATWRFVSSVADPLARAHHQAAVAAAWAARDPQPAFASVAALPSSWTREQLLRDLSWEIARRDPRLAIDLVQTIADDPDGDALLQAVADQWGRSDPAAAARWVETVDAWRQGQLAYRIADAYLVQNREEALAWALRISRSPGRNLWSYMVGQIAIENPHEALRLAQAAENPAQRAQALGRALVSIAAHDPHLAMSYLQKLPAGDGRTRIAGQMAVQIARARPDSAIDWLERLEDRQMRIEVADEIASLLANRDPDAAARLLDRIPQEVRSIWITSVAAAYANSDLDKGVQWVAAHDDETGAAAFQFALSIASRSPETALEVLDRLGDEPRERALSAVLPIIARQSPEAAAHSVAEISDVNARASAAARVAGVWSRYDEPAARKWVQSLERGPVRDQALGDVVAHAPPDEQLSLIGQIQSVDQRMKVVVNTYMQLSQADPEAARTLLRRYPLDPQHQQRLDSMTAPGRETGKTIRR